MTNKYNLNTKLPHRKLKSGEYIFREGDKGDFAYIIEKGIVEISSIIENQYTLLNTLQTGDIFGELALVDGSFRSASAYAKTDVILTVVTDEQVGSRIDEANPILKLLLTMVTKYFRSETVRLRTTQIEGDLASINLTKEEYQGKVIQAIELIRLESDLRDGFEQGELKLYFQPIISLKTRNIVGFEVLLRWFSPNRGLISPLVFIPLAESTSLIIPIGSWVLDEALQSIQAIQAQTGENIFLSLNIAQKQINDPNFVEMLKQKITNSDVEPRQIKLEILERSLFEGDMALALAKSCRDFGLPLMIDDFGTGYANLAYLTQYDFDTIKIDRFFIDQLKDDSKEKMICRALIDLSQGLQMTTVAEGIETQEQLKILCDLGCDFGQGYLFSPPVCFEDAIRLIQNRVNYD